LKMNAFAGKLRREWWQTLVHLVRKFEIKEEETSRD
jgi:hypothetical protein